MVVFANSDLLRDDKGQRVSLSLADTIAQANGYPFIEAMLKVHAGQRLVLNPQSYVVQGISAGQPEGVS